MAELGPARAAAADLCRRRLRYCGAGRRVEAVPACCGWHSVVLEMSTTARPGGVDQSVEAQSDGKDKFWHEMTAAERKAAELLGWDSVRTGAKRPLRRHP